MMMRIGRDKIFLCGEGESESDTTMDKVFRGLIFQNFINNYSLKNIF